MSNADANKDLFLQLFPNWNEKPESVNECLQRQPDAERQRLITLYTERASRGEPIFQESK